MSEMIHETLRGLLCGLGDAIRDAVVSGRTHLDAVRLSAVAGHAGGDTIYAVDKISEAAIARASGVAQVLAGHGLDDEALSNLARVIAERAERSAMIIRKAPE